MGAMMVVPVLELRGKQSASSRTVLLVATSVDLMQAMALDALHNFSMPLPGKTGNFATWQFLASQTDDK